MISVEPSAGSTAPEGLQQSLDGLLTRAAALANMALALRKELVGYEEPPQTESPSDTIPGMIGRWIDITYATAAHLDIAAEHLSALGVQFSIKPDGDDSVGGRVVI